MFELLSKRLYTSAGLLFGLAGLVAAGQSSAACLNAPPGVPSGTGQFTPAVFRMDDRAGLGLLQVNDDDEDAAIVGVWKFKLDGFLTDFGTQAFHAGGTEMMFSAGVDPSTGDVCQGAWRKIGDSTYTLNHIAMAWTAPGAQYGLLIHIHMTIQLAPSGNEFTGHYSVSLFSETPQDPFNESGAPFASGTGHITARRLQPD